MNATFLHFRIFNTIYSLRLLYCSLFLLFTLPLQINAIEQELEEQVRTWNENNQHSIHINKITTTLDWETLVLISNIQVSWTNDDAPYIMPTHALEHVQTIFPTILIYSMQRIPTIDNDFLLETIYSFSISPQVFTELLQHSILQRYVPDENIFSIHITYKTELFPILYNHILPQYNERSIPKSLSIDYKNNFKYSSIIFATEQDIPIANDNTTHIPFAPKLFPRVYGWNASLVFTPEYYNRQDTEATGRAYSYFTINNIFAINAGVHPYIVSPQTTSTKENGDISISKIDTITIMNNASLRNAIKKGKVFFALPTNNNTANNTTNTTIVTYQDKKNNEKD